MVFGRCEHHLRAGFSLAGPTHHSKLLEDYASACLTCSARCRPSRHFIHSVHACACAAFSFSEDDPYFTGIFLMEGAAGKTGVDAMVVMDGISNAKVRCRLSQLKIRAC